MKCARRVRLAPALRSWLRSSPSPSVIYHYRLTSGVVVTRGETRSQEPKRKAGRHLRSRGLAQDWGESPSEIHPVSSGANGACEVQCADLLIRESPQIQSLAQLQCHSTRPHRMTEPPWQWFQGVRPPRRALTAAHHRTPRF